VDIARGKFPERNIPRVDPSYELPRERWTLNVSKAERELDIHWIPLEMVCDGSPGAAV